MSAVLELAGIRRAYRRGALVLDGVDLSLAPGEVVGLLGRNGAGKTTLLRVALGLVEPQEGTSRLFGLDPCTDPVAVRRRVGYVAEDQELPEFLRVEEVVALHRRLHPTWDAALERDLAGRFALAPRARLRDLSRGQARRVALLCAVCHRPELLLLDEPAGGLDPAARREFLATAIRLLDETGCAILFSSHYMSDIERLAGRVVMLHEGRVLVDDELDRLREGFAVARLPRAPGVGRAALLALDGCLGARERSDGWHAVFRLPAAAALAVVTRAFGDAGARCDAVALEEMFIELAGGG